MSLAAGADACKFFVTGVKDHEYQCQVYGFQSGFLESEDQCQGSQYRCQVYGFQSRFLESEDRVKDLSTGVKYMDSLNL